MARREDPKSNHLLAALSDTDWQRWRARLEFVDLARGYVLHEPGRPRRHAYFPTSAVVSRVCKVASGATTEIAVVGNEGVVGISLLLGTHGATNGSEVLISGHGFRIGAQAIQEEFHRSDTVRRLLLRYVQALVSQIAQTAICNRLHSIEQQLCSFLLHSLDRLPSDEIVVTQELIARMLGVRRESVTAAAGQLQQEGLIHYARGHVVVVDRTELERRSCECHAVVKKEYDRLLPPSSAAPPPDQNQRSRPALREADPARLCCSS